MDKNNEPEIVTNSVVDGVSIRWYEKPIGQLGLIIFAGIMSFLVGYVLKHYFHL